MVRAGAPRAPARGVTDLAIGSSDWLGRVGDIIVKLCNIEIGNRPG